jgi:FixJ family two-component response regulator
MPGITGLELQQRLKALGEAMPIIVLTSSATPHTRVHALEQGAFAYLAKPVDEKILIRCLMEALRSDRPTIDRS